MLIVAILRRKSKVKQVISKVNDDTAIDQAIEIAKGAMVNSKASAAFVYIKHGADKPILLKKMNISWTGKVKVR